MERLSYDDDWPLSCDNTRLLWNDVIAENLHYADGMVKTNVPAAELLCPRNAQQSIALGEASLMRSDLDACWYQPSMSSTNSTIDSSLGMLSNESSPPSQTVAPADILIDISMDFSEGQAFSAPTQILGAPSRPDLIRGQPSKGPLAHSEKKKDSQRCNESDEPQSKKICATFTPSKKGPFHMQRNGMFECKESWCRRGFKRQKHLKRHMNSHSNKKPHVCWVPECHRAFVRPDHLNAHYKNVHSKKGGRNRYVASLDETSPFYDPNYRGQLTSDGHPLYVTSI